MAKEENNNLPILDDCVQANQIQYEDCGLFISLNTIPPSSGKEFFDKEIKEGIFKKYRENIETFTGESGNPDFEGFYHPKGYYLFGNFDLAVISLIDDYSLACKDYHPYHHYMKGIEDQDSLPFNYQVITGTQPMLAENEGCRIKQIAQKTFLKEGFNSNFPFIGITSIKISNLLLIGKGMTVVKMIEMKIAECVNKLKSKRKNVSLEFIIVESFSWAELTIVFFSDSYKTISDIVVTLREFRVEEMFGENHADLLKDALVNFFLDKEDDDEKNKIKLGKSHVFTNTYTVFGYDMNMHDKTDKSVVWKKWEDKLKEIKAFVGWQIKSGHLRSSIDSFEIDEKDAELEFIVGKTDFTIATKGQEFATSLATFERLAQGSWKELHKHVKGMETIPHIKYSLKDLAEVREELELSSELSPVEESHFYANDRLKEYSFNLKELQKLKSDLCKLNVSKIIREKVHNMFVNFNEGMQDPLLYGFFIDLRNFLKWFLSQIAILLDKTKTGNLKEINEIQDLINEMVLHFELAFKNRYQNTYKLKDVTDYNMEYNGGIQQIVTGFDSIYKTITRKFAEDGKLNYSFVYVSGVTGISSSRGSVRLNYYHIFQPEIFFSHIVKEAINFYFERRTFNLVVLRERRPLLYKAILKNYLYKCYSNEILDIVRKDEIFKIKKFKSFGFLLKRNAKIFSYIYSDIIHYLCGFNFDYKLYSLWYWGGFCSQTRNYNTKGLINEFVFIKALFRYLVLMKLDENATEDYLSDSPNLVLNFWWSRHYQNMTDLIDKVFELSFDNTQIIADLESIIEGASKSENIDELNLESLRESSLNYLNEIRNGVSKDIQGENNSVDDIRTEMVELLKDSLEVIRVDLSLSGLCRSAFMVGLDLACEDLFGLIARDSETAYPFFKIIPQIKQEEIAKTEVSFKPIESFQNKMKIAGYDDFYIFRKKIIANRKEFIINKLKTGELIDFESLTALLHSKRGIPILNT